MAIFTDGNSDSHNDSWTTTDIKSNGKNEPTRIIFFISSLVENLNLKLEMFVVSLSGVVCAGGGPEIKFQMIVETDVGVLCGLRVFTLVRQLSTLPARVPANNQGYICHRAGIFLSEILAVFSFTSHPPTAHIYTNYIRLADLTGSFSVQWTIAQYISVELAGWN